MKLTKKKFLRLEIFEVNDLKLIKAVKNNFEN